MPLALTAYPLLRWRHPVNLVALVVIGGRRCADDAPGRGRNGRGVLGMVMGVAFFAHTWWRIERSVDRERRALIWMALTVGGVGVRRPGR